MGNFELNESMVDVISSEFGLPMEGVKHIYDEYTTHINGLMEKQYLGHSIRAIEEFVYFNRDNHSVHIMCRGLNCPRPVCFEYNSCFLIVYPLNMDEKDIRMSIAHELGHLFFNTQFRKGVYNEENEKNLEAVANVFGLLVIFGRNTFYDGKIDPFKGAAWQRIIADYANVCKPRKTGS